jgi:hypothetical protein
MLKIITKNIIGAINGITILIVYLIFEAESRKKAAL